MHSKKIYSTVMGIMFLFLCWFVIFEVKVFNPQLLPSPIITFENFFKLILSGKLNYSIAITLYRWFIGFFLALVFAIPFGLIFGASKIFREIFDFPLDFFRSLPVTALFPLFLILFGIGDFSKIGMVFAAVFPIIALNASYGVLHTSKKRYLMAKLFGANKYFIFRKIIFWEALPHIAVGMRLSLATSLIVVIISEMFIGTQYGLGQKLFDAYSINNIMELYSILILIGIIGYGLNKVFLFFEQKIIIWVGK